jgi:hypothetical protein
MVGERATDRSHRKIEPLSDVFYCDHGVAIVLPQNSCIGEGESSISTFDNHIVVRIAKRLDSMSSQPINTFVRTFAQI